YNNNNYNNNNYNNNYSGNSSYNGVTVYVASWFKGEHAVYGEGRFDLRNSSLKSNISSLSIQPGYRVTVFEDYDFRGRSMTFSSSTANLAGLGWNDNIRSFIVFRPY
ncbi:MAG TPA: beta/gamma crystallin-related protein, partial [Chitinophagaceae bacterium]|nr:beta/gamma crystallin-related protein [Chitinophagaceae bacterium]